MTVCLFIQSFVLNQNVSFLIFSIASVNHCQYVFIHRKQCRWIYTVFTTNVTLMSILLCPFHYYFLKPAMLSTCCHLMILPAHRSLYVLKGNTEHWETCIQGVLNIFLKLDMTICYEENCHTSYITKHSCGMCVSYYHKM